MELACDWQPCLMKGTCREKIDALNPSFTEESERNQPCIGCLLKSHNHRQKVGRSSLCDRELEILKPFSRAVPLSKDEVLPQDD